MDMIAIGVVKMNSAGKTWIERVDRADDLKRFLVLRDGRSDQRLFVCRTISFGISRARIPRAWHYELIVVDLLVLYTDPVGERSTRSFI
jgi:hypothetical protein